jgi:hypothetical protein
MKIVPFDNDNWKKDHPTGNIAFQHMLKGDPESRENFMYILGRQDGDFAMPRHRHNFEQIRLPICGDMHIGPGLKLGEGQVGYFPEGLAYGPQEDPLGNAKPGERLQLVLQFGGASGYGFMSIEQRRLAWAELEKEGKFVGPYFERPDGKREWGLNTIWQHVFGVKLKYPRPRYRKVVVADPTRFNWLQIAGATGADHKYMGSFSERGVWIEMVRVHANSEWTSTDPRARRLFVVLSGSGSAGGAQLGHLTALDVEAGETLKLTANETIELFLIGLPPIELPAVESEQYDADEIRPEDTVD